MDQILAILRQYGDTLSPEMLQQADAALQQAGWHQEFGSAGNPRGRLYGPNGETVDLGDFGGPLQWVPRANWTGNPPWLGGNPDSGGAPPADNGGATSGASVPTSTSPPIGTGGQPVFGSGGVLNTQGITDALRGTPGYQFAFNEGQRAVQSSAASRGTLLTGGTVKALAQYGTGLADQTYGEAVNRYQNLADLGARVATSNF